MEKYLNWFILCLKLHMKKRGSLLLLLAMLVIVPVLWSVKVPDGTNTTVLICYNGSSHQETISGHLLQNDSLQFVEAHSEEEVIKAVEKGKAECGFVLSTSFDASVSKNQWDEIVTCYISPFSTKSEVAKEKLFASLYVVYSEWLLQHTEEEIYGDHNPERMEQLLAANQTYLNDHLFLDIEKQYIETSAASTKSLYPIQGIVGLFVFFSMLMASGIYFEKEIHLIQKALPFREKNKFVWIHIVCAGIPVAFMGFILILLSGQSRGFIMELLLMLLLLLLNSIWGMLLSRIFKNELTFYSWQLTILVVHLIFCPIFFNIGDYAPTLGFISYLLPVGWYLMG